MNAQTSTGGAATRSAAGSGGTLADVLDRVLDKGIVIDAWARVSLIGVEILTVEAKVVVASVETYLKFAEEMAAVGLPPAERAKPKPKPAPPPQAELPSEDEIVELLAENADGLQVEQIAEYFHAPRKRLEETVGHLIEVQKARRDKANNLILPAPAKH